MMQPKRHNTKFLFKTKDVLNSFLNLDIIRYIVNKDVRQVMLAKGNVFKK